MPLSAESIEWLFGRLTLTYGRDFLARYEGQDAQAVAGSWAHELAAFAPCMHVLDWALEHLPVKPPSVLEFRALCRAAPAAVLPRLAAPAADPARAAVALRRLAELTAQIRRTPQGNARDWADQKLAEHAAGKPVSLFSLKSARQVVRMRAVA